MTIPRIRFLGIFLFSTKAGFTPHSANRHSRSPISAPFERSVLLSQKRFHFCRQNRAKFTLQQKRLSVKTPPKKVSCSRLQFRIPNYEFRIIQKRLAVHSPNRENLTIPAEKVFSAKPHPRKVLTPQLTIPHSELRIPNYTFLIPYVPIPQKRLSVKAPLKRVSRPQPTIPHSELRIPNYTFLIPHVPIPQKRLPM